MRLLIDLTLMDSLFPNEWSLLTKTSLSEMNRCGKKQIDIHQRQLDYIMKCMPFCVWVTISGKLPIRL